VLVGTLADAGFPGYFSSAIRPEQNDAVASSGGDKVMVTWNAGNSVNVVGFGANGASGSPVQIANEQPGWWVISNCGTDCAVAGVVPAAGQRPVTLSFFNEDLTPISRGSWDLICGTAGTATERTTLSLATSGGRLGALITTPSSVKLYVCDLPPGPP
jgi:hypothetical protein